MEFKNERLKTSFRLPEPFTVRDHDEWEEARSEAMLAGAKSNLTVNWLSATAIIKDWQSEIIPDVVFTLQETQELSNEQIAVVSWVGTVVIGYVVGLLTVPKASSEPPPSAPPSEEMTTDE